MTDPWKLRADAAAIPAIELLSVEKIFENGNRALAPMSLSVPQGAFVSLIGPSGCGKSTLLQLMANLLQPSAGRVQWWRADAQALGGQGRQLAFVFQEPTLMPWANVAANVRLPLSLAGMRKPEAAARVQAALAQVELHKHGAAYPRQLSGGMRMRVSIARALVTDPDLLLMDEPFGALDEFTRNRLDEDLLALSSMRRLTTIFVTHSIYEAVFLSGRVVVMAANPGRIFAEYAVEEPQPRGEEFRLSDRFAAHCRALTALLNDASRASRAP